MTVKLTHPEWNQEIGGLEVAEAFAAQIKGKTVLITGISPSSIGSSISLSIASQSPALLILASRTLSKLSEVASTITSSYPHVSVCTVPLDLMSQSSIEASAAAVTKLTSTLDIVINNAGLMTQTRQLTAENIEGQFGANHIGHFLFTNLLMPLILAAAKINPPGATRIINLTSLGHRLSPIRFHDVNLEGKEVPPEELFPGELPAMFQATGEDGYNGYIAYGQAKTANILFSVSLTEKLKKEGVVSYAVHPGCLSRDLDADGEEAIRKTSPFWKNHDQGAATILVAAFDPVLNKPQGILLHDCQIMDPAPHATDSKIAERLWALSESLVAREFKL
ncbi:NAD(P)-binding protein [Lindgomyces ingoldianus]|uniref:NAD(P)-binding protein n=1 Tax=Lindgomyces ingoldianus TaxID=673940 RepID=A0ACB6QSL2_9PLEO|nr:NAD(P)-binding protein [Lindgomyces ingoldianus]KAF2469978.1 NAD(P)-binding protein [Lindgomyces ingoldianus]